MSAYLSEKGSHIIPFSSSATANESEESLGHPPALPQLEIENFFIRARQIEFVLNQERTHKVKLQKELQDIRIKFTNLQRDAEMNLKDLSSQRDDLKSHLQTQQGVEDQLRLQNNHFTKIAEDLQKELREIQLKHSQLAREYDNRVKENATRHEKVRLQLNQHGFLERQLRDQVQSLTQQLTDATQQASSRTEEKQKTELELERVRTQLQESKVKEETLKSSTHNTRFKEKVLQEGHDKLKRQINQMRIELQRYKAAWSRAVDAERRAGEILHYSDDTKRKLAELTEALSNEKRRAETWEQMMKKEKREKQIALDCLNSAEAKLAQVIKDFEDYRRLKGTTIQESGLELKF